MVSASTWHLVRASLLCHCMSEGITWSDRASLISSVFLLTNPGIPSCGTYLQTWFNPLLKISPQNTINIWLWGLSFNKSFESDKHSNHSGGYTLALPSTLSKVVLGVKIARARFWYSCQCWWGFGKRECSHLWENWNAMWLFWKVTWQKIQSLLNDCSLWPTLHISRSPSLRIGVGLGLYSELLTAT